MQSLDWLFPTFTVVLALMHGLAVMGGDPTWSHQGMSNHSKREHAAQIRDSPNLNLSRPCTVDELLPVQTESKVAPEWSTEFVADSPFDCTCPFYRARQVHFALFPLRCCCWFGSAPYPVRMGAKRYINSYPC